MTDRGRHDINEFKTPTRYGLQIITSAGRFLRRIAKRI